MYLGGYSISLISRPDCLRAQELFPPWGGVPNDGSESFPVLSGGSRCRRARPQLVPWGIPRVPFSAGTADGDSQSRGALQSDTGHLCGAKRALSAQ